MLDVALFEDTPIVIHTLSTVRQTLILDWVIHHLKVSQLLTDFFLPGLAKVLLRFVLEISNTCSSVIWSDFKQLL